MKAKLRDFLIPDLQKQKKNERKKRPLIKHRNINLKYA